MSIIVARAFLPNGIEITVDSKGVCISQEELNPWSSGTSYSSVHISDISLLIASLQKLKQEHSYDTW